MKNIWIISISLLSLFFIQFAMAEPWLANRMAQNCAGCHSPARRNVEAKERRCTLNCQGCHANPNGGGIRNEYGVWTQNRWLKSFDTKEKHHAIPAPMKKQAYGDMPENLDPKDKDAMKKYIGMAKKGAPLAALKKAEYHGTDYDRTDGQEFITVQSKVEQLARMTDVDPYRIERQQRTFAGADFRWIYFDGEAETSVGGATPTTRTLDDAGPMALDIGLRHRPAREHLQLVAEARFYNRPTIVTGGQTSLEWTVTSGEQIRSFYALYDDLPYNTYVQYGLYRPQFGSGTPDHSNLFNQIVYADNSNTAGNFSIHANSAQTLNKVLSVGGSPNVPFFNIHYIQPLDNFDQYKLAGEDGFALNLGGRFVSYGASVMLSYWDTEGRRSLATGVLKTKMLGIALGASLFDSRYTVNLDWAQVEKEFSPGQSDKGTVMSLENKFRVWNEVYFVYNRGSANVTQAIKAGESFENSIGVKSFLWPNTEFEFLMVQRQSDADNGDEFNMDILQGQFHYFF